MVQNNSYTFKEGKKNKEWDAKNWLSLEVHTIQVRGSALIRPKATNSFSNSATYHQISGGHDDQNKKNKKHKKKEEKKGIEDYD